MPFDPEQKKFTYTPDEPAVIRPDCGYGEAPSCCERHRTEYLAMRDKVLEKDDKE